MNEACPYTLPWD